MMQGPIRATDRTPPGTARRVFWFVGLYAAGVGVVTLFAEGLKYLVFG